MLISSVSFPVTPCVGVWIEIMRKLGFRIKWVVTPCVGVWIEIVRRSGSFFAELVTPCVGVWIEIAPCSYRQYPFPSLPVWECGLKL